VAGIMRQALPGLPPVHRQAVVGICPHRTDERACPQGLPLVHMSATCPKHDSYVELKSVRVDECKPLPSLEKVQETMAFFRNPCSTASGRRAEGSLRTSTRINIKRAHMTHLQNEWAYRRAEEDD